MMDAITRCRNTALAILKPSARDLEYGLRLHEESLVVESYGLGLHAPVDAEQLRAAAEAGASALERQDLFEKMIMLGWLERAELRSEYQRAWETAGVNCIFLNAGEEHHDPRRLLKRFSRYIHLIDAMPDVLERISTANDIENISFSGKRGLCLTLNSVPLALEHFNVEEELGHIQTFSHLGARMMHLTYNRANLLGSGCAEAHDGGLTDFGAAVIHEMNRCGVIIDLAHSGWQTTLEAAKRSRYPVVVSHSAATAVHEHIRGKPDAVIRAVVEGGGTMGITNIPTFLGGNGNLKSMLDHIEHVVQKFGEDAVTIGMDAVYRSSQATASPAEIVSLLGRRRRWEDFWPAGQDVFEAEWNRAEQIDSMAWTNWPMITVGLVQRGFSDCTIRKILGENMLRVAREVWLSPGPSLSVYESSLL